jgi:ribosomal protein L24
MNEIMIGDRVRILAGEYKGCFGDVKRMIPQLNLLGVTVDYSGRKIPAQYGPEHISPVHSWNYFSRHIQEWENKWEEADREMHEARERSEDAENEAKRMRALRDAAFPSGNPSGWEPDEEDIIYGAYQYEGTAREPFRRDYE